MSGSGATGSAKNLVKGLALLRIIADSGGGSTLADVGRLSGLPKPTAHRLLAVLAEAGMVEEDAQGAYRLGPQCLALGDAFLEGLDLRREAKGILERLASETGETCHLGVRDGSNVVYVEKVESPQAIQLKSRVGFLSPVCPTALGKAMLAFGDEEDLERVLAEGLEKRTSNTITEPGEYRAALAIIRERGFAVDDVENEAGVRCVAAPVFGHRGAVAAGISVSGPEFRMPLAALEELGGGVLREAALELSRRIGYRAVSDADEKGGRDVMLES